MALNGKRVLFFAGPLYEDLELWYPKIRLEEEGVKTTVAGLGRNHTPESAVTPLPYDANVDDVEAGQFDGLVIPGGFAPESDAALREGAAAHARHLQGRKAGGVHLPRRLGAHSGQDSQGKAGTSVRAIKDDMENAGVIWEDSPVVVDGNLISSRTPADLPALTTALIAASEKSGVGSQESGAPLNSGARVPSGRS